MQALSDFADPRGPARKRLSMQLVCFDIDGTLVDSADVDGTLYADSVRAVLGIELDSDWSRFENVSDSGILHELVERHLPPSSRKAAAEEVRSQFVSNTRAHFAANPHSVREIPGARALVEALLQSPEVAVGIATGGWKETAALKLRAIGLEPDRIAMATSTDAMRRTEIMRLAESRATNGERVAKRTYFGDGVWDQQAARELGYAFIGVGAAVDHNIVFPDLRDLDAILARLGV